jgi:hypothetical protein
MTIAATTLPSPALPRPRGIGLLAIATGVASFALLAIHPGGDATDFAGVLKDEAANRVMDAVVHGGFVVVLALQAVCYAALSMRLGVARGAVLAALVFFAFGTVFLSGSMLVDGLLTPAVAARYIARPEKIEAARALFVLMGSAIGVLMPLGLAFQAAAVAAWGWALAAAGSRAMGVFAMILGAAMLAGAAAGTVNPIGLIGAIVGAAVWAFVAGAKLLRAER